MKLGIRRSFQVLVPGTSLRRRIAEQPGDRAAHLVPVIVLSVYYLLQVGWLVDRIVSFDRRPRPWRQASIEMLQARQERNDLLLYDPVRCRPIAIPCSGWNRS